MTLNGTLFEVHYATLIRQFLFVGKMSRKLEYIVKHV